MGISRERMREVALLFGHSDEDFEQMWADFLALRQLIESEAQARRFRKGSREYRALGNALVSFNSLTRH